MALTCDLISKVMSSEICVPYRFNAWNMRTSPIMLVIWTWIGVRRWHPWFTLTLWPLRGQPRLSEINDFWWRHMSFIGLLCPGVNWCADFKFGIRLTRCVEMFRNGDIGVIEYPKEKWSFLRKIILFYFDPSKWSVGVQKATHNIPKTVRNVMIFKSRLYLAQIRSYRRNPIWAIFGSLTWPQRSPVDPGP